MTYCFGFIIKDLEKSVNILIVFAHFYLWSIITIAFSFLFSGTLVFSIRAKLSSNGKVYHVDTYQDYLAFMNQLNRSTDPELVSYREPIPALHELAKKCSVMPHVMLTTNCFIGATHVIGSVSTAAPFPDGTSYKKVKIYRHPNPELDITVFVTRDHYPNLTPMKRYFGSDLLGPDFYAYSRSLHPQSGGRYIPEGCEYKGLYINGPLTSQQNNSIVYLKNPYQGPKLQLLCIGGDSSGPVFKRVSHTGDVFEDFRYFGFNNTGNPNIKVINASSPEVSPWITNTIIAEALGVDRPSALIDTPLDERSHKDWLQLDDTWRDFFSTQDFNRLPYAGGILVDPSWVVGVPGKDFLDSQAVFLKKIRFFSVDDYVNTHQQIQRLEVAKVIELEKGRSVALLKKPYLGNLPILRINFQDTISLLLHSPNLSSEEQASAEQAVKETMQITNKVQNIMIKEALSSP